MREHLLEALLERRGVAAHDGVFGVHERTEKHHRVGLFRLHLRKQRVQGLVRRVVDARERPRGDRDGQRAVRGRGGGRARRGRRRCGDHALRHQAVPARVLALHAHHLPREEREARHVAQLEADAHAVGGGDRALELHGLLVQAPLAVAHHAPDHGHVVLRRRVHRAAAVQAGVRGFARVGEGAEPALEHLRLVRDAVAHAPRVAAQDRTRALRRENAHAHRGRVLARAPPSPRRARAKSRPARSWRRHAGAAWRTRRCPAPDASPRARRRRPARGAARRRWRRGLARARARRVRRRSSRRACLLPPRGHRGERRVDGGIRHLHVQRARFEALREAPLAVDVRLRGLDGVRLLGGRDVPLEVRAEGLHVRGGGHVRLHLRLVHGVVRVPGRRQILGRGLEVVAHREALLGDVVALAELEALRLERGGDLHDVRHAEIGGGAGTTGANGCARREMASWRVRARDFPPRLKRGAKFF